MSDTTEYKYPPRMAWADTIKELETRIAELEAESNRRLEDLGFAAKNWQTLRLELSTALARIAELEAENKGLKVENIEAYQLLVSACQHNGSQWKVMADRWLDRNKEKG
jgi:chromosome segregation ATPase